MECVMKSYQHIKEEPVPQEILDWLKDNRATCSKADILAVLVPMLPLVKPGTMAHHEIVETILNIAPEAAKLAPVDTLDALSQSFLWVGSEYIPHIAQRILAVEKNAINLNPNRSLSALEKILTVCHCVFIPLEIHGRGSENDSCLEWQRQTFFSIIDAIETKATDVDPSVSANVLKISEIITYMNDKFSDLNQRIKYITHAA